MKAKAGEIVFSIEDVPVLVMKQDGFYYKDQRVDDIYELYDKTHLFLKRWHNGLEGLKNAKVKN